MTREQTSTETADTAVSGGSAATAGARGVAPGGSRPRGFVERVGAALAAPRSALAHADEKHAAGTAGSDLAALIGLSFLATHAPEIAFTLWVAVAESVGQGLGSLAGVVSRAVALDLAMLFAAGAVLTVAAGKKRALGRDFDLVCVAFVPVVVVRLCAELFAHLSGMTLTGTGQSLVAWTAYGWAGLLLLRAWQTARARTPEAPDSGGAPEADGVADFPGPSGPRSGVRMRARAAGAVVLGAAGLLLVWQIRWIGDNLEQLRPVSPGDVAPLFTVPEIDEHGAVVAARALSLSELRGRVVIVDFWATWCGPCIASLPAIERVHQRYRDQGLFVVSLNMDDPRKARALMRARGYTLPLYADNGWASDAYKVTSIPHLVIIDRHGVVRHVHRGFDGEHTLDRQVARLLD